MGEATVGIDFGTSTTLVAVRPGGGHETVLALGESNLWVPSVVEVTPGGHLVGEVAEAGHPDRVLRSIKRSITREQDEVEFPDGSAVKVDDVVSSILAESVARARSLGHDLTAMRVQMGCPAIWRQPQRERLARIASGLGLDVDTPDIVDEPIAAGIAWVEHQWATTGSRPRGRVLVFDSGGGTLDIALLLVGGEEEPEITVLSVAGLDEAGDAVDDAIATDLAAVSPDLGERHLHTRAVTMAARELKERLSFAEEQTVLVTGEPPLPASYRRTELEQQIEPQVQRATRLAQAAVRAGRARELFQQDGPTSIRQQPWEELAGSVEHVLLSGGTSAIPAMQRALAELFPKAQVLADQGVSSTQASVVSGLSYADTYGRLNLPRPALTFSVVFRGTERASGQTVTLEEQVLYPAFEPLFTPAQVMRGETALGFERPFSYPAQLRGPVEAVLVCRAVDRDATPIHFRVGAKKFRGVPVPMQPGSEGMFKLYVDGRILWTGNRAGGARVVHTVERWPTLRGARHDWALEMTPEEDAAWGYHEDNWWQFR